MLIHFHKGIVSERTNNHITRWARALRHTSISGFHQVFNKKCWLYNVRFKGSEQNSKEAMRCRYPHLSAGLGLIYAWKFVYRGWDFHLHEDRAALKVVLLLTLEMWTSQLCVCSRDFSRRSKGWLNILSQGTCSSFRYRARPLPHELNKPRVPSSTRRNILH